MREMFKESLISLIFLLCVHSNPLNFSFLEDFEDEKYDVVIDQRQNGTQNFRVRLNGLSIALPEEIDSSHSPQTDSDLASILLSSLSTASQASTSSSNSNDEKNEFTDLASIFNWKTSDKKSADTQSRTKNIPTEEQLTNDTRDSIRNYVKGSGRKYKLLIGEKYIIPLIQFLKQQVNESID